MRVTKQQAIELAARQATARPMADPELIAGIIDVLESIGLIWFEPDEISRAYDEAAKTSLADGHV
jgi:hypothetical protein